MAGNETNFKYEALVSQPNIVRLTIFQLKFAIYDSSNWKWLSRVIHAPDSKWSEFVKQLKTHTSGTKSGKMYSSILGIPYMEIYLLNSMKNLFGTREAFQSIQKMIPCIGPSFVKHKFVVNDKECIPWTVGSLKRKEIAYENAIFHALMNYSATFIKCGCDKRFNQLRIL